MFHATESMFHAKFFGERYALGCRHQRQPYHTNLNKTQLKFGVLYLHSEFEQNFKVGNF